MRYRPALKYPEDVLDYEWCFEAADQGEADRKIYGWNLYHSRRDAPGWGFAIAKPVPNDCTYPLHNEYVTSF